MQHNEGLKLKKGEKIPLRKTFKLKIGRGCRILNNLGNRKQDGVSSFFMGDKLTSKLNFWLLSSSLASFLKIASWLIRYLSESISNCQVFCIFSMLYKEAIMIKGDSISSIGQQNWFDLFPMTVIRTIGSNLKLTNWLIGQLSENRFFRILSFLWIIYEWADKNTTHLRNISIELNWCRKVIQLSASV